MNFLEIKNKNFLYIIIFILFYLVGYLITINSDANVYYNYLFTKKGFYKNLNLQNELRTENVNLLGIICVSIFLIITFFVGKIFQKFLKIKGSIFSGFIFGFLLIVVIYRTFSFFFPNYLSFFIINLILLFFIIYYFKNKNENLIFNGSKIEFFFKIVFFLFVFIFSSLIIIDMGDFTFVGHGPDPYIRPMSKLENLSFRYPIIHQNYEHLIFNYWLLYLQKYFFLKRETLDPLIWMWITMGLLKASLVIFSYEVLKKYINSIYAFLICLFLCIGTSSLDFTKYFALFDSFNFISYIAQPSRIFPIFVVFLILNYLPIVDSIKLETNKRNSFFYAILLLAFGISATSFINIAWIILILISLSLYFIDLEQSNYKFPFINKYNFLNFYKYIAISLFLFLIFMYGDPETISGLNYRIYLIGITFILLVLYFILCGDKIFRNDYKLFFNNYKNQLFIILSTIFFAIIFGSFISKGFYDIFGIEKFLKLNSFFKNDAPMTQSSQLDFVDVREKRSFGEYNASSYKFIAYYGSIILIISMPIFIFLKNKLNLENFNKSEKHYLHINFYLLAILPIVYTIIDFMYVFASRSWMKTRFLEFPIYFLMISSLIFIFSSKDKFFKNFLVLFLLISSIMPFLSTSKVQHIVYNFSLFLKIFN